MLFAEIDQITTFVAIFGQKTGNKLQYIVNNGGQNNVIIAKKSNFIHRYEIAHKTAFFSTRIMAPGREVKLSNWKDAGVNQQDFLR